MHIDIRPKYPIAGHFLLPTTTLDTIQRVALIENTLISRVRFRSTVERRNDRAGVDAIG